MKQAVWSPVGNVHLAQCVLWVLRSIQRWNLTRGGQNGNHESSSTADRGHTKVKQFVFKRIVTELFNSPHLLLTKANAGPKQPKSIYSVYYYSAFWDFNILVKFCTWVLPGENYFTGFEHWWFRAAPQQTLVVRQEILICHHSHTDCPILTNLLTCDESTPLNTFQLPYLTVVTAAPSGDRKCHVLHSGLQFEDGWCQQPQLYPGKPSEVRS